MPGAMDVVPRETERHALEGFLHSDTAHATLGLFSGRRRIGKSTIARTWTEGGDGFYYEAPVDVTYRRSLDLLREQLAAYLNATPPDFFDWPEALDVLLGLGRDREVPVVIDGINALRVTDMRFPEFFHDAFAPSRPEVRASRTRLLVTGSAATNDGKPMLRHRLLRERAALDLRMEPLDYRAAAEWWGLEDPLVAFPVYAVLGGTPVYRDWADDRPAHPGDVGRFAKDTVLNAANPLFMTARHMLSEEPGPLDFGFGKTIPFTITHITSSLDLMLRHINTPLADLRPHLAVLTAVGLLEREEDLFRRPDLLYRIAEPLLNFYHAMMRPDWMRWQRGLIRDHLWQRRHQRFQEKVLHHQWARVCRQWTRTYAEPDLFGAERVHVGSGFVMNTDRWLPYEVNVAAFGESRDDRPRVLALGRTRWHLPMDMTDLARLQRIRDLLVQDGKHDAADAVLVCYGGSGFTPELEAAAKDGEAMLVSPEVVYGIA